MTTPPTKDAECSVCRQRLHLFMSEGMDSKGNRFLTPMYTPCRTCMKHEHMRGMITGIAAVLDKEEQ